MSAADALLTLALTALVWAAVLLVGYLARRFLD